MRLSLLSNRVNALLVQLLGLGQTLFLGALLRDLAVIVRLGRAWCSRVGSHLGLDSIDDAAALVLALVNGLRISMSK